MASTAPAKSQQTLNNFTLPFDLKWSTGKSNGGGAAAAAGGGDSSNSNNNDGGVSSGGGGGGGRSKKRSMKYRDSAGRKVPAAVAVAGVVVQSDSVSFESEKVTTRNHHQQHQVFSVSCSSDRLIDKLDKKVHADRLIEKSEKRAVVAVKEVVEEKKVLTYHHSILKEKKVSVSDRLIEKLEKKVASTPDRLFEKSEKKVHDSDRLVDVLDKRSNRFMERLEKKESVLDRLAEKSEKKATGSDRGMEKLEKKARVSDLLIAKPDKKAMATVHDQPVDTREKKVMLSESCAEKKEEKLDGMDIKSKLLIRFKAKSKAEDGAEEGLEVVPGGEGGGSGSGGGGEGDELEVKTWNLRPRKPISKKMDVNGGSSMFKGGVALIQESNKPTQSPQTGGGTNNKTKNDTLRVRTHADAKIAQSSVKKSRITIPLLKEEIEEDIFVMTGSKPNRRPKKRPRNVQKQLDSVFPGLWLSTISADAYKVSETIPKGC